MGQTDHNKDRRQADRQTDMQTDRRTKTNIDRQTDRQTETVTGAMAEAQTKIGLSDSYMKKDWKTGRKRRNWREIRTTTRKIATETEIRIYNRERETVAGSERG